MGLVYRWIATYGSTTNCCQPSHRDKLVWTSEGPIRWGGAWADMWRSSSESSTRCQHRLAWRWARCEVRPMVLQAEPAAQHARYEVHRISTVVFLRTDAPARPVLQVSSNDDRLLDGAVPQPHDALRAWTATRNPQSWQGVVREAYGGHWTHAMQPRAIHSMALIMREVKAILQRTSMCLGFDGSKGYKLMCFKCDVPTASWSNRTARMLILHYLVSSSGRLCRACVS